MTPERWSRLKTLFTQALEVGASERPEFIQNVCGGDSELASQLTALMREYESATASLDRPLISQTRLLEYVLSGIRAFASGDIAGGRFRIVRFIAEGGMGEVYEAEDLELGGCVAVKTLRPAIASHASVVARFKQEIQLARKVTHPNASRIFDIFRHDFPDQGGVVTFLTMEMLAGETLSARIARAGRMRQDEAMALIEQIARGLAAVHAEGIIHRDFKSPNVMLVEQPGGRIRAVVTDFGLAREKSSEWPQPGTGGFEGTMAYAAPEQIENLPLSPAADIYSLGVVMFEIVTGRLPFLGDTPREQGAKRLQEDPPSPREFAPDLDRRWEQTILACLQRDPGARPQTALEVLDRLQTRRQTSRRWLLAFAGAATIGTAFNWWWSRPTPVDPRAEKSFKLGLELVRRRSVEDLQNAIRYFQEAVRVAPTYSAAWVELANAYSAAANFNFIDPKLALDQARLAARRAVELSPRQAKAVGVLAYVTSIDVKEWLKAEPDFRRAIGLNPREPTVCLWYGAYLGKLRRVEEAFIQLKAGLVQDPSSLALNQQLATEYFWSGQLQKYQEQALLVKQIQSREPTALMALARALEWQGKYQEALQFCDEAERYGNRPAARCFRGCIEAARGNLPAARRLAAEVEAYWRDKPFESILLANLFCRLGDRASAIRVLNAGYDRYDSTVLTAYSNPYMDVLRDEPAYQLFLQRLGLGEHR